MRLIFVLPSCVGLWKSVAYGDGNGMEFDDTQFGISRIDRLDVGVQGSSVRRLDVTYAAANLSHGTGGITHSLKLDAGEFITDMLLGLSGGVVAIEFETSRGRNASFGAGGNSRVRLTAPNEALGLVAFHGFAADTLNSLGGYWEVCAFCDPGEKAVLKDGDCICEECPENTVSEAASVECAACPAGFVSRPGSDTCFTERSKKKKRSGPSILVVAFFAVCILLVLVIATALCYCVKTCCCRCCDDYDDDPHLSPPAKQRGTTTIYSDA